MRIKSVFYGSFTSIFTIILFVSCKCATEETQGVMLAENNALKARIRYLEILQRNTISEVKSVASDLKSDTTNGLDRLAFLSADEHGEIGLEFSKLRSSLWTWKEIEKLEKQNLTEILKCVLGQVRQITGRETKNFTVPLNFCSSCENQNDTNKQEILINGARDLRNLTSANQITSLEVIGGIVDRTELIKFLNHTKKLTILFINARSNANQDKLFERISLPNLKEFISDIKPPIGFDAKLLKGLIKTARGDLKTLLFFDHPNFPNWEMKNVLQLQANISLSIDTVVLFKVNHGSGEIVSMFKFININQILPNLPCSGMILKRLAVAFMPDLNLDYIPPDDLTHLNLFLVGFNNTRGGKLSNFLERCHKLAELQICIDYNTTDDKIFTLSNLPPTLRRLTLDGHILSATDLVKPIELEEFTCFWCHFSIEIVQNFSSIFKVKKVAIHALDSDPNAEALLLELVKPTSTAETIIMTRTRSLSTREGIAASAFLLYKGILLNSKVFILEKDGDGVWSGRDFVGEEWLENDYRTRFQQFISFDGYKMYKIF